MWRALQALDATMDRPLAGEGSWMRINLGHLITISTLVIGFLITAEQVKDQVGTVQRDMKDLKDQVKDLQISINTNAIKVTTMSDTLDAQEKHIESSDLRITAVESITKTLDTNMQLINQQLQYIGTSHVIEPSRKK
jgi:septal ring factor EnvC (AmiA/AmiB activator)